MTTTTLTQENFDDTIQNNDMVVVDFWAPWCGPCRAFAPTFDKSSEKHTDIVHAKVNTDEQQELAAAFNIRSIPTLMVFREQVLLYSEPGSLPPQAFEQLIQKVREIDMAKVHEEIAKEEADSAEGADSTAGADSKGQADSKGKTNSKGSGSEPS